MSISADQIKAVLEALGNENFDWRTIDGVSKETGLSIEEVIDALNAASDKIVKSPDQSPDGKELFASREHFRKKASTLDKILGAIKNRAV